MKKTENNKKRAYRAGTFWSGLILCGAAIALTVLWVLFLIEFKKDPDPFGIEEMGPAAIVLVLVLPFTLALLFGFYYGPWIAIAFLTAAGILQICMSFLPDEKFFKRGTTLRVVSIFEAIVGAGVTFVFAETRNVVMTIAALVVFTAAVSLNLLSLARVPAASGGSGKGAALPASYKSGYYVGREYRGDRNGLTNGYYVGRGTEARPPAEDGTRVSDNREE